MTTCGMELSEDYYNQVSCERELGHEGKHCSVYTWPQSEAEANSAQCQLHGHVWGEWKPYVKPAPPPPREPSRDARADIADVLLSQMQVNLSSSFLGGEPVETHPLTKTRNCTRCGCYDNDQEFEYPEGPSLSFIGPGVGDVTSKWIEDRLNPEGDV